MPRSRSCVRTSLLRAGSVLLVLALMLSAIPAAAAAPTRPAEPKVTAYSAIVIDYDTGETLYEKDADTMRVPASMTKVMTAYIIMEELESGNLTLDTMVPVSANAARISRDSSYPTAVPLTTGSTISVDTLLKLIMIPSASACCIVMAEYIAGSEAAFVERMNDTASRLGLDAAYQNCHGARVHYISARSQALLIREFIDRFPRILDYTSMTSVYFNGTTWSNTNKLLPGGAYAYPGADGFKTGTITAAGYCLSATATRDGHRIISVVMRSSNTNTRHTDSTALLNYGFQILADMADYRDVTYHWSREVVERLAAMGVEFHTQDGLFRPDDPMTRAEFAAMLYTALDNSGALSAGQEDAKKTEILFNDVSGHWAESYITSLAGMGMIVGSDGFFYPDDTITRQETMVLLDRMLDLPDQNGLGFSDDGQIAVWALEAAARTTAAGLFTGSDGRLMPTAPTTRAEGATLIDRILGWFPVVDIL